MSTTEQFFGQVEYFGRTWSAIIIELIVFDFKDRLPKLKLSLRWLLELASWNRSRECHEESPPPLGWGALSMLQCQAQNRR